MKCQDIPPIDFGSLKCSEGISQPLSFYVKTEDAIQTSNGRFIVKNPEGWIYLDREMRMPHRQLKDVEFIQK